MIGRTYMDPGDRLSGRPGPATPAPQPAGEADQ